MKTKFIVQIYSADKQTMKQHYSDISDARHHLKNAIKTHIQEAQRILRGGARTDEITEEKEVLDTKKFKTFCKVLLAGTRENVSCCAYSVRKNIYLIKYNRAKDFTKKALARQKICYFDA